MSDCGVLNYNRFYSKTYMDEKLVKIKELVESEDTQNKEIGERMLLMYSQSHQAHPSFFRIGKYYTVSFVIDFPDGTYKIERLENTLCTMDGRRDGVIGMGTGSLYVGNILEWEVSKKKILKFFGIE